MTIEDSYRLILQERARVWVETFLKTVWLSKLMARMCHSNRGRNWRDYPEIR